MCERVTSERSLNLILTVTVRADDAAPRSMVATDSAMRSTWRSSSSVSTRSSAEGLLVPDRLGGRFGRTGSGSSPRARADRWAPLALPRRRTTVSSGQRRQVADRAHAEFVEAAGRRRADAPQGLDIVGVEELELSLGVDEVHAGSGLQTLPGVARGLAAREASLAIILDRPTPTAHRRPSSVVHPVAQSVGDPLGRSEQPDRPGHVHERLVEPDGLDHRRDVVEHGVELCADLGVAAVTSREEDG